MAVLMNSQPGTSDRIYSHQGFRILKVLRPRDTGHGTFVAYKYKMLCWLPKAQGFPGFRCLFSIYQIKGMKLLASQLQCNYLVSDRCLHPQSPKMAK
jgi:hypothetical protein